MKYYKNPNYIAGAVMWGVVAVPGFFFGVWFVNPFGLALWWGGAALMFWGFIESL